MSVRIVQKETEVITGWINIQNNSWPAIGIKEGKKRNIHGLAFNNKSELKKTINFLKSALKEIEQNDQA